VNELIAQLAATPAALAHLVADADEEKLDASAQGEWSARTTLAHFRDDEFLCMRAALTRILAEDRPVVHFMDGADWEPNRIRTRERKEWLLADFALQRQASLGILRMLRPEDFGRVGLLDGMDLTIERLVGAWVKHDREHIAQLERAVGETLEQVRARRARPED
jgi:hypothetical protein